MDRWLNNAPALAFIKDLSTWLIINGRCEPILWSDDDKELAWLFACVLECGANNQTKLIVKNGRAKNPGELAVRRASRGGIQRPAVVVPIDRNKSQEVSPCGSLPKCLARPAN